MKLSQPPLASAKGGYGQDTGSVDPSQAKYELGIRCIFSNCVFPENVGTVNVGKVGKLEQ